MDIEARKAVVVKRWNGTVAATHHSDEAMLACSVVVAAEELAEQSIAGLGASEGNEWVARRWSSGGLEESSRKASGSGI